MRQSDSVSKGFLFCFVFYFQMLLKHARLTTFQKVKFFITEYILNHSEPKNTVQFFFIELYCSLRNCPQFDKLKALTCGALNE